MVESPLFDWLVQFHYDENLLGNLDSMKDGRLCDAKGKPLKEGYDKTSPTDGYLILEDGHTLVSRLITENIVLDHEQPEFISIGNYQQFARFLKGHKEADGAFFYDTMKSQIAKIARYNNKAPAMRTEEVVPKNFLSHIPPDFVFYDQTLPITSKQYDRDIGTKTDLGIRLPFIYSEELRCDVRAYLIKRSPYGEVGLGKVPQFGAQGLEREFFFQRDPEKNGGLLVPEQGLYGIVREYTPGEHHVIKTAERRISDLDLSTVI